MKIQITKDGDSWCVLLGNNLQEGIAGFGDNLYQALIDFTKQRCPHNVCISAGGSSNTRGECNVCGLWVKRG